MYQPNVWVRYYAPDLCRFISPDNFWYLDCVDNLFSYCENDPVNNYDENGHLSWSSAGLPNINSAQDQKDYNVLVQNVKKKLKTIGFKMTDARARGYLESTHRFKIRSFERRCHFLSQAAIETDWGNYMMEAGYLPRSKQEEYFLHTEYGYQYRGAGWLHLTWKENYKKFSKYMGDSEVYSQGANYVAKRYPWLSAGWYWTVFRNVNEVIDKGGADKQVVAAVTKSVNGAESQLKERMNAYKIIKKLLQEDVYEKI